MRVFFTHGQEYLKGDFLEEGLQGQWVNASIIYKLYPFAVTNEI